MSAGLVPAGQPRALGPDQGQAAPLVLLLALDSCPGQLGGGLIRVRMHEPGRPLLQDGFDGGRHGEGGVAEGCLQGQLLGPVDRPGVVAGAGADAVQAAAGCRVLNV